MSKDDKALQAYEKNLAAINLDNLPPIDGLEKQARIDSLRVELIKVLGELQISQKHACEQAVRANDAEKRNKAMHKAILYALDIDKRCHGDDYSYDSCWDKLRKAIG
jgi:hypothetical protein